MKVYRTVLTVAVLAAAALLFSEMAEARDKYLCSVVQEDPNPTAFTLTKSGKIIMQPSSKAGDGGTVIKLIMTNVDCPDAGNFKGKDKKCGDPEAQADAPTRNHVLELGVHAVGQDLPGVLYIGGGTPPVALAASGAGLLYSFEKGKAVFQATGKNKITGNDAFGALVTAIFGQPLGIGLIKFHEAGSDPSACATAPLSAQGDGSINPCIDGDVYAIAGFVSGTDPGLSCSGNTDCGITQVCTAGKCETETCTVDADCDQGGGTGSFQCGSGGTCCDPNLDPTCAGQVP